MSNAARLTGYRWISYYDDAEERSFSDWPRAERCMRCDREIVHVYEIEHPDGTVEIAGRECAHLALGWPRRRPGQLERLRREAVARENETERLADGLARSADRLAVADAGAALRDCRRRNRGMRPGTPVALLSRRGRYYVVPAGAAERVADRLRDRGWVWVNR